MGCHVERISNLKCIDISKCNLEHEKMEDLARELKIYNFQGICRLGVIRVIRNLYNEHGFAPTMLQTAIKLKIDPEDLKRACSKEWWKYCQIAGLPTIEGWNFEVKTVK